MEPRIITSYRRSARLLAGEVVGSIEPCPPASEPARAPMANFILAAAVAMLFVGLTSSAWALPQGAGTGCYVSGFTTADGGGLPNISNNLSTYERERHARTASARAGK
jgi:hypothetical protein